MTRLALLALLGCACRSDPTAQPTIEVASYATVPSNKLDVLLLIDDSNSTVELQTSFANALPALFERLDDLDLHVGVISPDLGTSGSMGEPAPPVGSIGQGGCAEHGDDGLLHHGNTSLADPFLIDEDDGLGGRRRNYSGGLAAAVGQMVKLGSPGCGFEQPLAAIKRALVNEANLGFARNDAHLLVVTLMDEDDCSIRDPRVVTMEPDLGPLDSFRCTRYGVSCDQPIDEVGDKTNCRPTEDSPYIEGITSFIDAMRIVRGDPTRVAFAAIAGPPEVRVELRSPPNGDPPMPALALSCGSGAEINSAQPGVRLAAVVDELAPNSVFVPSCPIDLAPAVSQVARVADGLRGITCLDTARIGTNPECSVILESVDGEVPLSLCPAAGDCFEIVDDVAACGYRPRLVVHVASPMANQYVRARCVVAD